MGDHGRVGTTYALTVLAPIRPGETEAVRATIEGLPLGEEGPFARLAQLHFSRLHIFDHLVYQGGDQKQDRLKSDWLVFTASIDGDLDAFLDAICERLPEEADSWWSHCVGYPGTSDRAAFKRWLRHNQVRTNLFGVAAPNATVSDIRESLALRERVLEFAIGAQGLEAAALQQRFRETFVEAG
jgi:hypothetical protein